MWSVSCRLALLHFRWWTGTPLDNEHFYTLNVFLMEASSVSQWQPVVTEAGSVSQWAPVVTEAHSISEWAPVVTESGSVGQWQPVVTEAGSSSHWMPIVTESSSVIQWMHVVTEAGNMSVSSLIHAHIAWECHIKTSIAPYIRLE